MSLPHTLFVLSIVIHYDILPFQTSVPCTLMCICLRRCISVISVCFSHSYHINLVAFETLPFQPQASFLIVGYFNRRHTRSGDSTTTSVADLWNAFLSTTDHFSFNYHPTLTSEHFTFLLHKSRFLTTHAGSLTELTGMLILHSLLFFSLYHSSRPLQICFIVSVTSLVFV